MIDISRNGGGRKPMSKKAICEGELGFMTQHFSVLSTYPFSTTYLQELQVAAQTDVLCVTAKEELLSRLPDAEILCSYWIPDNWRDLAPNLRWFQVAGGGIDGLRATGLLDAESDVLVTTAVGIHSLTVGEYVFGSMLMFNRSWPQMVRLQDQHIWPQSPHWYKLERRELFDQTLGIVGLGHIGRRVAQLGKAFGMRVLATRRSIQQVEEGAVDANVDRTYPIHMLQTMLSQCDYVVLAVPLTAETRQLIGEAELRAMNCHAYLVNVARGHIVDEKVLIHALKERWIGGAGIDVTEKEPLPSDSPLFTLPNVILTPHISGESIHYAKRLTALFADNLRRYRTGEPLRNRYDPVRRY
jgi:phosphoglycerate dehydrogenase-like enzyme